MADKNLPVKMADQGLASGTRKIDKGSLSQGEELERNRRKLRRRHRRRNG